MRLVPELASAHVLLSVHVHTSAQVQAIFQVATHHVQTISHELISLHVLFCGSLGDVTERVKEDPEFE